jgi:hypothetical protein
MAAVRRHQPAGTRSASLPDPEVSEDRKRDDYGADDVKRVGHGVPPSCPFTLGAGDPSAHWTLVQYSLAT